jgi:hypothetical protein
MVETTKQDVSLAKIVLSLKIVQQLSICGKEISKMSALNKATE